MYVVISTEQAVKHYTGSEGGIVCIIYSVLYSVLIFFLISQLSTFRLKHLSYCTS